MISTAPLSYSVHYCYRCSICRGVSRISFTEAMRARLLREHSEDCSGEVSLWTERRYQ